LGSGSHLTRGTAEVVVGTETKLVIGILYSVAGAS